MRPRKPRRVPSLGRPLLLLALLALTGCQRGCLTTWIRDRGSASKTATPLTMMSGVDCPDGLARCVGGAVEVSHVARIPRPCPPSSRPEDCQCPWEAVETCPQGCTEEGTEVVTPPDRAAARLCAPDPANPPARLAVGLAPPPGACDEAAPPPGTTLVGAATGEEGYRCVGSLVVACSASDGGSVAKVLAACLHGCFREGETLGEEEAEPEAATRILCARSAR